MTRWLPWALAAVWTLSACQPDALEGAATDKDLILGQWVLESAVGDTRYDFDSGGRFTLEIDSVTGDDTMVTSGDYSLDAQHRLTLSYEQQGIALRPVETLYVSTEQLVIGGVLIAQDGDPGGILGTWHTWRTTETGPSRAAVTRTVSFAEGGSGSVVTVLERSESGQTEPPEETTGSVTWTGAEPDYTLGGTLQGTYTRRGGQLVNLQQAFTRR